MVVQGLGAEVHAGELLHHQVEQVALVQLFQKFVEAEMLEDLPRNRVNGRIIRPYWDCLKSPRSKSATDQINAAVDEKLSVTHNTLIHIL